MASLSFEKWHQLRLEMVIFMVSLSEFRVKEPVMITDSQSNRQFADRQTDANTEQTLNIC